MRAAASALASIRIVSARPKPKPLAEQLRTGKLEMTLEAVMSLRQRGFFLTPMGQLLANEGEVIAETDTGLVYTLRFGEIVAGAGAPTGQEAVGDTESDGEAKKPPVADTGEQDRYLFVMISHDPELQSKYGGTGNGERTANYLNRKFADWYYVIAGEDFAKIRAK